MIAKYRRSQDIHLQQIQVDAWKKSYHGCHKVGESYLATIDNYPILHKLTIFKASRKSVIESRYTLGCPHHQYC